MKVSLHSQREYETKVRQIEQKYERLAQKNKATAKDNKYLNRRVKELSCSRDKWKAKNASKRLKIKALAKGVNAKDKVRRHHYALMLISLCVQLRIQAGCSYRGICKILQILQINFQLGLTRLPCANTIENWVSKMGYYCITHAPGEAMGKEVCLLMDESIKQGNERILLLLITPWQKEKQEALSNDDVRVCYLGGKSSWTGEKIKHEVEKIVAAHGIEIKGIVSDEDSKLLKAGRLLECPHLPDISHAIAGCLRKTFEKNANYQLLIKQIGAYQAKSVNQDLSYLRPPKQRIKARFMNQRDFVKWGLTMVAKFAVLTEKEKVFFAQLPAFEPMLKVLDRSIEVGRKVAQILKTKGLSNLTIKEVETYVHTGKRIIFKPEPSPKPCYENMTYDPTRAMFDLFLDHLKCYIEQYKAFLINHHGTFNVCSDIIESMFGKHKTFCGTNTLVGVSQLDLELPVHNLKRDDIDTWSRWALEFTFTADLKTWRKIHSSDNQADKRREFFQNKT
jgi:hypothetical protein